MASNVREKMPELYWRWKIGKNQVKNHHYNYDVQIILHTKITLILADDLGIMSN
jgi:hypothetical protein